MPAEALTASSGASEERRAARSEKDLEAGDFACICFLCQEGRCKSRPQQGRFAFVDFVTLLESLCRQ